MLTFSEIAQNRVNSFLERERAQGVVALRIAGDRREHKLWLVKEGDRQDSDTVIALDTFEIYLDPLTASNLEGATVDYVEGVMQSGFRIYFESTQWDDPLAQQVQDVIDRQINPGVASHGGEVTLERVEKDSAFIRFGGGCQGCGAANVTLKQGVERLIREAVPELKRIVDVTDHAAGENPYYVSSRQTDSPLA